MDSESSNFWVKITEIHCQNNSINFEYSVPDCSNSARYIICYSKDVIDDNHWCPNFFGTQRRLLKKGINSSTLEPHQVRKDTNYSIAIFKDGKADHNSSCRPEKQKAFEIFNFRNCPEFSKPSPTYNASLRSNQSIAAPMVTPMHSHDLGTEIMHPDDNVTTTIICLVLIGMFAICLVLAGIYWVRKKLRQSNALKTFGNPEKYAGDVERQEMVQLQNKNPIKIYLVFADDNPFHQKVVFAFANYLEQDLGFCVLFEPWETQKASENYSMWMKNAMESADKIIVVWSDKALEKVQAFKRNMFSYPDTFSPVVQHMQSDLFKYKHVKKYSFVYFGYSDIDSIPHEVFNKKEFRHFELMRDFEELYFHLINSERHQPGRYIYIPKVKFETLFDPKLNNNGPNLKKAIYEATTQISLLHREGETYGLAGTRSSEDSEFSQEQVSLTEAGVSIIPRASSQPSLPSHVESGTKRRLSVASMEDLTSFSDPQYLLHEVNNFTQLQETKYIRQQNTQPCCSYHRNSLNT